MYIKVFHVSDAYVFHEAAKRVFVIQRQLIDKHFHELLEV